MFDPMTAAVSGGASLLNQWQAQGHQKAEASKHRRWQEQMSSTAYQRQMKDMKAAGLNPMLASNTSGGASVGAGTSPSAAQTDLSSAIGAGLTAKKLKEEINVMRATKRNIDADTKNKGIDSTLKDAGTPSARILNKAGRATEEVYKFGTKGQIGEALGGIKDAFRANAKETTYKGSKFPAVNSAEYKAKQNYYKSQAYKDRRKKKWKK